MEPIFHAKDTVLQIGIALMAAVPALGVPILREDVLEAANDDSKRRQLDKRQN
jgi:hypothetical protein